MNDISDMPIRDLGFKIVLVALALAAAGISGHLAWAHFEGGSVAGCGGGDCGSVIASRWSVLFGVVPVAACGIAAWLALLYYVLGGRWRRVAALAGAIAGAAAWFVFVQAVLLEKFCPWCMAAHGIALTAAVPAIRRAARDETSGTVLRRFGMWAWGTILAIGLCQIYGPIPASHQVEEIGNADSAPVHERGKGPKASFANGTKTYDVASLPHLGPHAARHVMVEYFDYTCDACRTMHGFIESLRARYPDTICVIVLPVPLSRECNTSMNQGDREHPEACEIARVALALWRADPAAYQKSHGRLMAASSAAAAREVVLENLNSKTLEKFMADPWIGELIAANTRDWRMFSGKTNALPKLLVTDRRIVHGLPSSEEDFIRVMERELGL
ncbi:MAG: thioredoxin domain-containing protein [Verrucomicrobia bacterium]|nr:thioredoxin domain-containing protein [Verrucomicrobiota bacterium]